MKDAADATAAKARATRAALCNIGRVSPCATANIKPTAPTTSLPIGVEDGMETRQSVRRHVRDEGRRFIDRVAEIAARAMRPPIAPARGQAVSRLMAYRGARARRREPRSPRFARG